MVRLACLFAKSRKVQRILRAGLTPVANRFANARKSSVLQTAYFIAGPVVGMDHAPDIRAGIRISILENFNALGLNPTLLSAIEKQGYTAPTPIQQQAIPHVLAGRDLMGLAQTGTGKTAAFGLPLVHHLMERLGKPAPKTAKSLILAPTRELAKQIAANLKALTRGTPIHVNVVVGGVPIGKQAAELNRGTDVLVATPGRLLDLVKRNAIRLDSAQFLVLDEADQMLDLGFIHALRAIARLLASPRQTLLFSATMPKQMTEIAHTYLTNPVRIEIAAPGRAADKINQSVHFVPEPQKADLLIELLRADDQALSLVFARTKYGADKLTKKLTAAGFDTGAIHGNKNQNQRERVLNAFRKGAIRVLVATDVAARGLDIQGVSHVYNYELPDVPENYVHRIGRTARAGAEGRAIAFCAPAEFGSLLSIEKLMRMTVETAGGERPQKKLPGKPGGTSKANKRRGAPFKASQKRKRRFKKAA
jgi:ATP-dependent RNA helicase RhlE